MKQLLQFTQLTFTLIRSEKVKITIPEEEVFYKLYKQFYFACKNELNQTTNPKKERLKHYEKLQKIEETLSDYTTVDFRKIIWNVVAAIGNCYLFVKRSKESSTNPEYNVIAHAEFEKLSKPSNFNAIKYLHPRFKAAAIYDTLITRIEHLKTKGRILFDPYDDKEVENLMTSFEKYTDERMMKALIKLIETTHWIKLDDELHRLRLPKCEDIRKDPTNILKEKYCKLPTHAKKK